jgi:hypothetical protein
VRGAPPEPRRAGRPSNRARSMAAWEPPATAPPSLEWRFSQVFGERTPGEDVQEGEPRDPFDWGPAVAPRRAGEAQGASQEA